MRYHGLFSKKKFQISLDHETLSELILNQQSIICLIISKEKKKLELKENEILRAKIYNVQIIRYKTEPFPRSISKIHFRAQYKFV